VPILPGEHSIGVSWRSDGEVGSATRTPAVDIGAPASNISIRLTLPQNRWLLGTDGPALGPAVLYWSELVVLILVALILGRIDITPLKTQHWLLLGLGFSTFNWPALAFVADHYFGVTGIFVAYTIANVVTGVISYIWARSAVKGQCDVHAAPAPAVAEVP